MLSVTTRRLTFNFKLRYIFRWPRIAQLVQRLARNYTARGSNPGADEIFLTRPERPWGPPSLLYNGYPVFPGGKAAGGDDILTLLAPKLKEGQRCTFISPLVLRGLFQGKICLSPFCYIFRPNGHHPLLVFNKNIKENHVKIIGKFNTSFLYKCICKVKYFDSSRPKSGINLVLKWDIKGCLKNCTCYKLFDLLTSVLHLRGMRTCFTKYQ